MVIDFVFDTNSFLIENFVRYRIIAKNLIGKYFVTYSDKVPHEVSKSQVRHLKSSEKWPELC